MWPFLSEIMPRKRPRDVSLQQRNAGVSEGLLGIIPASPPEHPQQLLTRVGAGTIHARLLVTQPRVSAAEVAPLARGECFDGKRSLQARQNRWLSRSGTG